jgi:hypothetical protein
MNIKELETQVNELDSQFSSYHSLTESQFRLINDNLESINKKLDNHLVHSFADMCTKMTELQINQKWAFIIGGTVLGALMSTNAFLLKHLFTLLT